MIIRVYSFTCTFTSLEFFNVNRDVLAVAMFCKGAFSNCSESRDKTEKEKIKKFINSLLNSNPVLGAVFGKTVHFVQKDYNY